MMADWTDSETCEAGNRSGCEEEAMLAVPDLSNLMRVGGAQGEGDSEADGEQKKREERERKKAEVRKRLEESGKSGKKKKKGFLTPERKKKLRKVLMAKAADALKGEQLQKEKARTETLSKRTMAMPNLDAIEDHAKLDAIAQDMYKRWMTLEAEKYDVQGDVRAKDTDINELSITVNDLKGKFVKPTLKKVSKYDNKFKKTGLKEGESKQAFKVDLKKAKKEENVMDFINAKAKKEDKPEWSKAAKAKVVGEHDGEPKSEIEPTADAEAEEAEAEGEEAEEEEEEEEE